MCVVDHYKAPNLSYAFDFSMELIAPDWIFTRLLGHHREVGLEPEQVMELLDLSVEYHDRSLEIKLEFAEIREQLDIRDWTFDDAYLEEVESLVRRHAELFKEHEMLLFEYGRKGQEILTHEQERAAIRVYKEEEQRTFDVYGPIVERALDIVEGDARELLADETRLEKTA